MRESYENTHLLHNYTIFYHRFIEIVEAYLNKSPQLHHTRYLRDFATNNSRIIELVFFILIC